MASGANTLIKKDNKVFPLGTSSDGSFRHGLGYSNLVCIHSFSNETLNKLFDNFNQYVKIDYETSKNFNYYDSAYKKEEILKHEQFTEKEIFRALTLINENILHKENLHFFKEKYTHDLSMESAAGFAGILFLGRNKHFSRDYRYGEYLVDLDSHEITIGINITIKFDAIRKLTKPQLDFMCEVIDFDKLPKDFKNKFPNEFKKFINMQDFIYDSQYGEYKQKTKKTLESFNSYLDYVSTIDSNMLLQTFNQMSLERDSQISAFRKQEAKEDNEEHQEFIEAHEELHTKYLELLKLLKENNINPEINTTPKLKK